MRRSMCLLFAATLVPAFAVVLAGDELGDERLPRAESLTDARPAGGSRLPASPRVELDCSGAVPSVTRLWPPNHKLVAITIRGVSDGDTVSVNITRITQDEPVDDEGDGDTEPDAFGIGTPTALLRAERSGAGNGRVYEIAYLVSDDGLEVCAGSVTVCVPKSMGKGSSCIDDGQVYDATSVQTRGGLRVARGPLRSRAAPNPFNPSTRIEYTLPRAAVVSLTVYNAIGQRVRTLVAGEQSEGVHHALWNGNDDAGGTLPSGIYVYRLASGGLEETGRLVMIR